MWPIIVDVRRSISPWQALMQFLYMETHAFLTNTSAYKNITVCTSYECRQSHTAGSNQWHLLPPVLRPHLDPPEKGRKAWLCRVEPDVNQDGSNTCREHTGARTCGVKLLASIYQGTRISEQEQEDRLLWREHPIPSSHHQLASGFGHTFGLWWSP